MKVKFNSVMKKMYEVKKGDFILSFNLDLNKKEYKLVEDVLDPYVKKENQIELHFSNGSIMRTSKWHPTLFINGGKFEYKRADEFIIGDKTIDSLGSVITLSDINLNPDLDENYVDFTVRDNNNYFSTVDLSKPMVVGHNSRKGAAAIYIEPWHLDVADFLDLKKNSGEERRRTHELFPALWINGLFMDRVTEDKDWTLFDPYEVPHLTELYGDEFNIAYEAAEQDPKLRKQTIRAKDLWKHILTSYYESGSPFLTFKDRANITNPNKHTGVIHSSNLCLEIFQSTEENQYKVRIYLDPKSFENRRELLYNETDQIKVKDTETREGYSYKLAKHITSLDTIIIRSVLSTTEAEYKVYAVENVLSKQGKTAVCNLGSLNLSKVNKTEDIKQIIPIAVRMLDNVIDLNFYPVKKTKDTNLETRAIGLGVMGEAEYLAQQNIVFGSQAHYKEIDRLMSDVSYYTIEASSDLAKERKPYQDFKGSLWDQGIFPLDFTNSLTKALAEPHQQDWDALKAKVKAQGLRNGYLMAIAPTSSISILVGTTQAIEPVYKRKWYEDNLSGMIPVVVPNLTLDNWHCYVPAYELDQIKLIEAAAVRQKYIDQGQSLNIFIDPKKAKASYLSSIYQTAYKLNLKSTYYLRSESPDEKEFDAVDRSIECQGCQ
nr:MAG TPA: ribonucleotide-diphosphate reductase subunit alpha [Caudoviricetes sp.]